MIRCPKCDNDTRTSKLVTAMGDVMIAGTIATDPQPISAQVCTACGYIELYAPQPLDHVDAVQEKATIEELESVPATIPAAAGTIPA